MALDSLSWFIHLAEKGSFTKAAEGLCISQQTLSARLAALERELNARLVVRNTPLSLTPAGQSFLSYAQEQERARRDMIRQVGEASEGGAGVLKVAISTIRAMALIPPIVSEFRKSLPGVAFELFGGTNDELLRMGESGQVDVVVARFDKTHPNLTHQPLFKEEVMLLIHPQLLSQVMDMPAETAKELVEKEGLGLLRECPFLMEDDRDVSGLVANAEMKKAGIKAQGLVKCENITTLLSLCTQGLGAMFFPMSRVYSSAAPIENMVAIRLSQNACYEIGVGRPSNAEPWTPAQMFEDILGALFGE